jgi:hypothetical protein
MWRHLLIAPLLHAEGEGGREGGREGGSDWPCWHCSWSEGMCRRKEGRKGKGGGKEGGREGGREGGKEGGREGGKDRKKVPCPCRASQEDDVKSVFRIGTVSLVDVNIYIYIYIYMHIHDKTALNTIQCQSYLQRETEIFIKLRQGLPKWRQSRP